MSLAEFYSSVGDRHRSHADMLLIPCGTFRMGSDRHYPEEAPVHRVAVEGFLIDRTPVTNRQFKDFVRATGHVTFAEIPPDPHNYPGALPHMLDGWKSRHRNQCNGAGARTRSKFSPSQGQRSPPA